MMGQEHLEGNMRFHDVLRDEYIYNSVVIRTSTKQARLAITSGSDVEEGEALVTTDREAILLVWNLLQALRRQQYRQTPRKAAPKPVFDPELLHACPNCGGEGFVHVWDVIAECAICRGTGQTLY